MTPRDILTNPESSGMSLVVAVDKLFKGQCFAWEFDTIFEELKDLGIELDADAADRLMALLAIKANPAHLWDGGVFSNLVETLNFTECLSDTYNECSAGEVCWALEELLEFGKYYQEDFSYEMYNDDPRIYAAGCVANEGFFVVPEQLSFCLHEFNRMFSRSKKISDEQANKLLEMASGPLLESVDEDDVIQVQVAKLQEVREYCKYRMSNLKKELQALSAY